ncbi:hypothetical protein PG996_006705 [Apiospora saccharicola]|uniref:Uncharacterized protein n=1 Tax=Apiospora saccharicola TaxID=335842 RepID=A0ABR1VCD2_9PEZI
MTRRSSANSGSRRSSTATSATGSGFSALSGSGSSEAFSMDGSSEGRPRTPAPDVANSYRSHAPDYVFGVPRGPLPGEHSSPRPLSSFERVLSRHYGLAAGPNGNSTMPAGSTTGHNTQGHDPGSSSFRDPFGPLAVGRPRPNHSASPTQQPGASRSTWERISPNCPLPSQSVVGNLQAGSVTISGSNFTYYGSYPAMDRGAGGDPYTEAIGLMMVARDEHNQLLRDLDREDRGRR